MADLRIFRRAHRKHLTPPKLNVFPATSSEWVYPSNIRVDSFQSDFQTTLQKLPELNEYTITPFVNPEPAAYGLQVSKWKNFTNRKHKSAEILSDYETVRHYSIIVKEKIRHDRERKHLHAPPVLVSPQTPAGYYNGYYPGSGLATSNRTRFKVTRQRLQEINTYPAAAQTADITAYTPVKGQRIRFEVRNQTLVPTNSYPVLSVQPSALWLRFTPTKRTKYTHRIVSKLDRFPQTPAVVTEPVPSWRIDTFRAFSFRETLRKNPQLDQYEETIVVPTYAGTTFGIESIMYSTVGRSSLMNSTKGTSSEIHTTKGIDSEIK